jgi:hypothetical protein
MKDQLFAVIGFFILVGIGCQSPVGNNKGKGKETATTKYSISISPTPVNGVIDANVNNAEAESTIVLTVTPSNGYILSENSLVYNDGSDHIINNNSFIMPAHNVTITCSFYTREKEELDNGQEELTAILEFLQSSENVSKGFNTTDPITVSVTSIVSLENLYDTLATADKYVTLDLSTSGITEWNYVRGYIDGKKKVISLLLPDGVTNLKDNSYVNYEEGFASFENLRSISGTGVVTFGNAFVNCRLLTEINLPMATTIENGAFSGCNHLVELTLQSAKTIGYGAFEGCSRLSAINLPLVTVIHDNSFQGCFNLSEIAIPTVVSIGKLAFSECDLLTNIAIPAGTSIGDGAFSGCTSLSFTLTDIGNLSTIENGNILLDNNGTKLVSYPSASDIVNIPTGITLIGNYAFASSNLSSINSSVVTSIGENAFSHCNNLVEINLSSASMIGSNAFITCSKLTDVTLPNAVSIGSNAFALCSQLVTVNLPLATTFDNAAFLNCVNLSTLNIPLAISIGGYIFEGCAGLAYLCIPNVVSIGNYAFEFCWGLKTLKMGNIPPESVGDSIFQYIQSAITLQVPVGKLKIYQTWERANRPNFGMHATVNVVEVSE